MKSLALVAFLSLSLAAPNAFSCTEPGKGGIFPENNLYIPVSPLTPFTIEKEVFMSAIEKAEKIYAPVFTAQGRTLEIQRKWDDGTVNAYANRSGSTSVVAMFGGLARHPLVTADAFMLVICHELGHHLGGAPKVSGTFGSAGWASNEGQSDYFATLKCAREVWKDEDNKEVVKKLSVPATAKAACETAYKDPTEIAVCIRSAVAGKSLADTLSDLRKSGETKFETPDPAIVKSTFNQHPAAQCRLDTYFAGALCAVEDTNRLDPLDPKDPAPRTCYVDAGAQVGTRPLCWFKPGAPTSGGGGWPSAVAHQ